VNGSGLLVIRTTATFGETAASKMLELIEHAQSRKAKAEKLITTFAKVYTPIVTVGAVLLAVLPPVVIASRPFGGTELFRGALSLWVSRLSCFSSSRALRFRHIRSARFFGESARRAIGNSVKGADYSTCSRGQAVVFDKTGTLTQGKFSVRSAIAASGSSGDTSPTRQACGDRDFTRRIRWGRDPLVCGAIGVQAQRTALNMPSAGYGVFGPIQARSFSSDHGI
jgi:hypothetical protein